MLLQSFIHKSGENSELPEVTEAEGVAVVSTTAAAESIPWVKRSSHIIQPGSYQTDIRNFRVGWRRGRR